MDCIYSGRGSPLGIKPYLFTSSICGAFLFVRKTFQPLERLQLRVKTESLRFINFIYSLFKDLCVLCLFFWRKS